MIRYLKLLPLFIASFLAVFYFSADSFATDENAILQISPTRQMIELNPGDIYTGSFSVQNIGNQPLDYQLSVTPYQVLGENYSPDFSTENAYTNITDWLSFDFTTNTIAPNSSQVVNYTIKVPEDAPAGGQYATIMANNVSNAPNDAIQITSRVGTILYAQVNGNTREEGQILSHQIKGFSLQPPLSSVIRFENTGNIDAEAQITTTITSFFTGKTLYNNAENPESLIILPETTRAYKSTWNEAPSLGIFRVSQTVNFINQVSLQEKLVIICPIWLMCTALIAIISALLLVIISVIKHHRRKQGLAQFKHKL